MSETVNNIATVASTSNLYTTIGLSLFKLVQGLGIIKGKTDHLDFTQAEKLSANVTNFVVGYERSQGTLSRLNKIYPQLIDAVINRMTSDTAWTNLNSTIVSDLQKLRNGNILPYGDSTYFDAVVSRMFTWIFLNLDCNRPETFSPLAYNVYNSIIVKTAKDNGIEIGELIDDGKIKPVKKDIQGAVTSFLDSILGSNQIDEKGNVIPKDNTILFISIGVAVFIVVLLIIKSKG